MQEGLILLCGGVEALLQLDDVGVIDHLHDLQLTVLEPLVLQHLFDGNLLSTEQQKHMCVVTSRVYQRVLHCCSDRYGSDLSTLFASTRRTNMAQAVLPAT